MNENNQITFPNAPTQSEADAPVAGSGAATILGALTDPLKAFLGGQGIGQNVSEIITSSKDNPNEPGYGLIGGNNPYQAQTTTANLPWGTLILVAGLCFALYMIFKKG